MSDIEYPVTAVSPIRGEAPTELANEQRLVDSFFADVAAGLGKSTYTDAAGHQVDFRVVPFVRQ